MASAWMIAASTAIGAGCVAGYRGFKVRRAMKPAEVRNAGFWTDRRVLEAELLFFVLALGWPFSLIITLVVEGRGFFWGYVATIVYPLVVYIVVQGFYVYLGADLTVAKEELAARSERQRSQPED